MRLPAFVKVVEVGPRDGLQNEAKPIATAVKIDFINRLSLTGLKTIEVTSMVSPKWVPQLGDGERVFQQITKQPGIAYPILLPNLQGLERALAVDVAEIAVFTAASATFSQKNTHCSITESLARIDEVVKLARQKQLGIRAYISCALGCPYEGAIELSAVAQIAKALLNMGCHEISLGDTIGVGTPLQAQALIDCVSREVPIGQLAVHFHDTRGQALANILACLERGVHIVDSSVAGLGGCPYARGASGNVATEDVVYMLQGMGVETGIDLQKLVETGQFISAQIGRINQSKVGRAFNATRGEGDAD